jgi:5-methyltetrahydropteroyltriglutamate--homocysteine methyltransferase
VPIRPSASDQKTKLRIPGPSAAPTDSYWRSIEADAAQLAARTVHIDEPLLAGALAEPNAAELARSFARLRSILPNTRLILGAAPGAFAREALPLAVRLPVDALHLDTLARPHLLVEALAVAPAGLELLLPEATR